MLPKVLTFFWEGRIKKKIPLERKGGGTDSILLVDAEAVGSGHEGGEGWEIESSHHLYSPSSVGDASIATARRLSLSEP